MATPKSNSESKSSPGSSGRRSAAQSSVSSQASEEQREQAFLEEAAPLIFEVRTLDAARCLRLQTLAKRHGLSKSQFRGVLEGLAERGVVRLAFSWEELEPGEPGPPDAASPAKRAAAPADEKPPARSARSPSTASRLEKSFRERAASLLAKHGGITPESRAAVLAEGEKLGLRLADIQRIVAPLFAATSASDTSRASPATPAADAPPRQPPPVKAVKPPPLPTNASGSSGASGSASESGGEASPLNQPAGEEDATQEIIFVDDVDDEASADRGPLPPPLPPARPQNSVLEITEETLGAESSSGSGSPVPPPPAREARRERGSWFSGPAVSGNPAAMDAFLSRATEILAEQQGFHAQSYAMLMATAHDLGMNEAEFDAALRQFRGSADPPPAGGAAESDVASHLSAPLPNTGSGISGSTEGFGENVPPPPRSDQAPREAYRRYLLRALAQRTELGERTEEKLIREGIRKLGLSHVYAQQILWEVAGEQEIDVASRQEERQRQEAAEAERNDPLLQQFAREAVPILGQYRGVNAKSRVLLEAVGQQLGLTPEQTERGLEILQRQNGTTSDDDRLMQQRVETFQKYLSEVLPQLPQGVLTASIESTLAEVGIQLHGLTAEQTYPLIRDMAHRGSVRYVPHSQAVQHVTGLVDERMKQGLAIVGEVRDRVLAEGDQWGLDSDQVDEIIREMVESAERQRTKERQITTAALALACLAVGLIVILFAWLLVAEPWSTSIRAATDAESPGRSDALAEAPLEQHSAEPQRTKWWEDESLEVAYTLVRTSLEEPDKQVLQGITSGDEDQRGAAYESLISFAIDAVDDPIQSKGYQEMFVGCYALEPSDKSARHLGEALVRTIPRGDEQIHTTYPEGKQPFAPFYWTVETAACMLKHPALSEQRAQMLTGWIDAALGIVTDRNQPLHALKTQVARRLSQLLYGNLIASVAKGPDVSRSYYTALDTEARRYLPEGEHATWRRRYVRELLGADSSAWRGFTEQIKQLTESSDPLVVLRMVEIFERSSDLSLQRFLGPLLLARVGQPPRQLPDEGAVEEVAVTVREALGVTSPEDEARRWKQFAEEARDAVNEARSPASELEGILNDISRLVHYATMGVALSQEDLGLATFEQLLQDGPVPLRTTDLSPAASSPRASDRRRSTSAYERRFERNIGMMNGTRNRVERAQLFVAMASMAPHYPDLDAESARILATYLMASKTEAEHRMIQPFLEKARSWPLLRLAVADELDKMRSRDNQVEEMTDILLDGKLDPSDFEQWRTTTRNQLYESALAEVAGHAGGDEGDQTAVDHLRDTLVDRYQKQARLLGVAPEDIVQASSPSQLLESLIHQHVAQQELPRADRPDAAARDSNDRAGSGRLPFELPQQLAAIEFVAENDLQRTVLLQRLWLQRLVQGGQLSAGAEQRRAAEAIYQRLLEADQQSPHILVQLRNGESALVEYWLTHVK